jgi:hypothetical protein
MAATGLLVRYRGGRLGTTEGPALAFIASTVVRFIRYDVTVSRFPGSVLGMALITGRIVPVISLGKETNALIVCELDGEAIAFSGLEPIRSGFFEGSDTKAIESGENVPEFPIREMVERARGSRSRLTTITEEDSWMR